MLKAKKKVLIASLLFLSVTSYKLLPTDCNAYISFERTYGGMSWDRAYAVQQTIPDGGYILAGWTTSFSTDFEAYLVKTDSLGDTLWTKHYGIPGVFTCGRSFSVQQTVPDGGYILAGAIVNDSCIAGDNDVYLIKTNSLGDTLWTKVYGDTADDYGWSVLQTSDGYYVITGYSNSFGPGSGDVWLLKTDSQGDTLWAKTYGSVNRDIGYSVGETSDGGYVITGYVNHNPSGPWSDLYLLKTDSLGNTLWTKRYGGPDMDEGHSVQQTTDGGYIIAGCKGCNLETSDVWLIKTDSFGDTLWTRIYDRNSYGDESFSVKQTSDGGYIIAGISKSSSLLNSMDLYLIKTDSFGDTLWIRNYDYDGTNNRPDEGRSVQLTSDGGYIIAGQTGNNDLYLVKPDIWGPEILSACASDGAMPGPGIDDDDYVLLTFDDPTNKPNIPPMFGIIDSVLALSGGHTWRDGFGMIESAVWDSSGTRLQINLSTNGGFPTVAVGDTITPDGVTITDLDKWRNPCVKPVVITCSFDPVGVDEEDFRLKIDDLRFTLLQNHPNPFHSSTAIRYQIPGIRGQGTGVSEELTVHLAIYDITGRLVETLVDEPQTPGVYQIQWTPDSKTPGLIHSRTPSGIYFYRLQSGEFTSTKRMTLLR